MFTVYEIISKSTNKIYIGQTMDIELRLRQHNGLENGCRSKYTKQNKGPWILLYSEDHKTRTEALKREKQLKSYRGRESIKNLI
jgi:putative endonuclease